IMCRPAIKNDFNDRHPTTNLLRLPRCSLYVHLSMIQADGQPLSQPNGAKPKGNYTGERLKALRPETYRRVVELLAEPREHVSIREICRQCHVTDDTVKAVEKREAIPIATRKEALMVQAARIAKRAYDRVEDQIDSAPLPEAVVTAGVFTDKLQLLSGDVTSRLLSVDVHADAVDLVAQFNKLHDAIRAKAKAIEAQSEETEGKTGLPSSKET